MHKSGQRYKLKPLDYRINDKMVMCFGSNIPLNGQGRDEYDTSWGQQTQGDKNLVMTEQ